MRFKFLLLPVFLIAACTSEMPVGYYDTTTTSQTSWLRSMSENSGQNKFPDLEPNPVIIAAERPVSTFSIDVDTVSYAYMRRTLNSGALPERAAVRVEELVNYFSYNYPRPKQADVPFRPTVAVYPTPWNPKTKLIHIGIKGYDVATRTRPRANLVFLIDCSGSMEPSDKLPLLKQGLRMLLKTLDPGDKVSIVAYGNQAGVLLKPTPVREKLKIMAALWRLGAGGGTAGGSGIQEAYALAEEAYDPKGINRVILATDGDFNIGISDAGQLKRLIEDKRKSGIFLSVLGFGQDNYNDRIMQALAQNGNGNAAYIDTLREAQKVLVHEASSTLFPIAQDVKIQVEFNPAMVAEYRLIGYETRALRRQDFNNDHVDAGDIGSGHAVTAIYEITPANGAFRFIDDLRYPAASSKTKPSSKGEYAYLKMRYKLPKASKSKRLQFAITTAHERTSLAGVPRDIQFAAAVAAFGQKLGGSDHLADMNYGAIRKLATAARGKDKHGYRAEFLGLIGLAEAMSERVVASSN